MRGVCIVGTAECLCSRQYKIVGFLFSLKNKTAVKFHYYTYPRKNDHESVTHFAFVDLLFFQEGKCDWFSYGQLVFPWSIFGGGRGFGKGKITSKLRSTNQPASLNSVVKFVWLRILVEKVRSCLYVVFNCFEYGSSLLRERFSITFETSKQTRVYACKK